MQNNRDILIRLRVVYFGFVLLGLAVVGRAFTIGVVERDKWLKEKKKEVLKFHKVEPSRGNIYAEDGSLLATSLPIYTVRLDFEVKRLQKIYPDSASLLVDGLHRLFPETSKADFRKSLDRAFKIKTHALVARNINYQKLAELRKLPILCQRAKAGMVLEQEERRVMPFRRLAYKTLGNIYDKGKKTGLEAFYDKYLKGVSGERLKQKMSGGVWKNVNTENEIEPEDGLDVLTSIDIQLQDVADAALRKQLIANKAERGTVVVMEVKTGRVKAMCNLSRFGKDSASYTEESNLAVSSKWDPGSTFKLASVLALLDAGVADTSDMVDTQGGKINLCDKVTIEDSHEGGYGRISLANAFAQSSNVGIIKAVMRGFSKQPVKFIDQLKKFHLDVKSGIDLTEELAPTLYYPGHEKWSCLSLPSLAMGYEILITPMQLLTFFNAVANNGTMVRPHLVKEVQRNGQLVKRFDPVVIDSAICSFAAAQKAKALMKRVVNGGTAKKLRNPLYQIAGKTGTVKKKQKIKVNGKMDEKISYRASFAGFFPYDDPKYSCIVVIENPTQKGIYGAEVAAPVFKDIADQIYAREAGMHKKPQIIKSEKDVSFTDAGAGVSTDYQTILKKSGIATTVPAGEWARLKNKGSELRAVPQKVTSTQMPDLTGMGLRDALYLLENMGLSVKVNGKGKVRNQSVTPGVTIIPGAQIIIDLT